jgi:hypothetical protein
VAVDLCTCFEKNDKQKIIIDKTHTHTHTHTQCTGCTPPGLYEPSASTTAKSVPCDVATFSCKCDAGKGCEGATDYGGEIDEAWRLVGDVVALPDATGTAAAASVATMVSAVYNISFAAESERSVSYRPIAERPFAEQSAASRSVASRSVASRPGRRALFAAQHQASSASTASSVPSGMWGAAFSTISGVRQPTLIEAMTAGANLPNLFAICLQPVGGRLAIGAALPGQLSSRFATAALVSRDFWSVEFLDVRLDGVSIGVEPATYNALHAIVDTGTPSPNIPDVAWPALERAFQGLCATRPGLVGVCTGVPAGGKDLLNGGCFNMTAAQVAAFPTIEFVLRGTS